MAAEMSIRTPDSNSGLRTRRWLSAVVFGGWTLLVWGSRIRNIVADDDLTGSVRTASLLMALTFVIPAAVVGVVAVRAWRNRQRPARWVAQVVVTLAAWTIGVWLFRALDIAVDPGHSVGFRVVHSALALVSMVIAVWAAVNWTDRRPATVSGR